MKNVFIMDHPLIQHKISLLRKKETGTNEFRKLVEEIAVLIGFEAFRDLPLEEVEVETPIEKCMTPMLAGKKLGIRLEQMADEVTDTLTVIEVAGIKHIVYYQRKLNAIQFGAANT